MKKISLLLIFSTLLLFVFSCKSDEKAKEEAAEEMAEEFVENLLESASDAGVDIDINGDGETAELTIEGEDGTVVKFSNEGNEIPENFPDDVHLIKGEVESVGLVGSDEGEMITVIINPKDSFDDVVKEIKKEMESNGWKSTMNMNVDGEAMLMYMKGDNSATITVSGKEEKLQAAYMVTVAK